MIQDFAKGRCFRILLYHSIMDNYKDPYAVTVQDFKTQMDWIADNGYSVISLKAALESLNNAGICMNQKSLVLTFDDGFVDFLENAIPVLTRHDFQATIFTVVSEIGNLSSWRSGDLNMRLMDWKSLKEILSLGFSIGSHGLHHYDLTKLDQKKLDEETVFSRDVIQKNLDVEADVFSYPWGICTRREVDSVKKAGYNSAVVVDAGGHCYNSPGADPFLLKRISIEHKDSLEMFIEKLGATCK